MALEQREIQILLSYVQDPKSRAVIQATMDQLGGGFKTAEEAAAALNAELDQLTAKIAAIRDPTQRAAGLEALTGLKATTKAALDAGEANGTLNTTFLEQQQLLQDYGKDLNVVNGELVLVDKNADKGSKSIRNFGGAMRWAIAGAAAMQIGRTISSAGKSVIGLAGGYAKGADKNDAVAQRWLATMERIDQAQMRIGRTLATQVNPYLEKLAKIAENIASFAEKHPELVALAAKVAIGGIIGGGAIEKIGTPLLLTASLLRGVGASGMAGAAGAGVAGAGGTALVGSAAATGGLSIAVIVAAVAAYMGYEKLKRPEQAEGVGGMLSEAWGSAKNLNFIQMMGVAKLTDALHITEGQAQRVADVINKFNKGIEDTGNAAEDAANKIDKSLIKSFVEYQKAESDAAIKFNDERNGIEEKAAAERVQIEANAEAERNQIIANGAEQRAQELANFNLDMSRQLRDAATEESRQEEDWLLQRSETIKSSNKEAIRSEEDFQREMRNKRLDHEARMDELLASRDVLGMAREQRSYERERRQDTEAHQVDMQRLKADNADKLAEMDAQYAREKERRQSDQNTRLQDQQADFDARMEQEKAAEAKRLAEIDRQKAAELAKLKIKTTEQLHALDVQYAAEKQKRYAAFIQQLADLDLFTGKTKASWDKFYADMETKLKAFIAKAQGMGGTGTVPSGHAGGGYGYAPGELAQEWVMSNATMRQAERFVGGRLTQGNVLGALSGGGISIGNITLPGTNMNEPQLTRFIQDKFPGLLANALQKAKANVPL